MHSAVTLVILKYKNPVILCVTIKMKLTLSHNELNIAQNILFLGGIVQTILSNGGN